MARAAASSGVTTVVATPHLHPDFPEVRVTELASSCQAIRDELAREKIPLEVVSGAEVSIQWALEATEDELALASYGQLGNDLLIEVPFTEVGPVEPLRHLLEETHYRITLAHPERSAHFQRDDASLRLLVEHGALLQINAESLIGGSRWSGPRRLARTLVVEGLAHVIASDGHRATGWRPITRLVEGVKAAAALVGQERAEWMAQAAPAAIMRGERLPHPPPVGTAPKHRRWFGLTQT